MVMSPAEMISPSTTVSTLLTPSLHEIAVASVPPALAIAVVETDRSFVVPAVTVTVPSERIRESAETVDLASMLV